ncbi:hypothetical protein E4V51_15175 [Paenibacillus sp. 28ISP30-2]|nr:hypothetical protein [Paenibacillus sp. 28ISP30-2]
MRLNSKRVDQIQLGQLVLNDILIDFGVFHENTDYISGLIGMDILKSAEMLIDLHQMEMYSAIK